MSFEDLGNVKLERKVLFDDFWGDQVAHGIDVVSAMDANQALRGVFRHEQTPFDAP